MGKLQGKETKLTGPVARFLVSFVIGFALLWWSFRDLDLDGLLRQWGSFNAWVLVPYIAIFVLIHLIRIARWGVLVRPLGQVGGSTLFVVGSVGLLAVVLLPLRLGEFVRPYLLSERTEIPMSSALATVVVERTVDGILTVLLLFGLLVFVPPMNVPPFVRVGGWTALVFFSVALVVLALALWQHRRASEMLGRSLGHIAPGIVVRLQRLLAEFVQGLAALPDLRSVMSFLLMTAAYWGMNAWGMQLLLAGFGHHLPITASAMAMTILVIGIMIPAGPAFVGNFEAALILSLGMFGLSSTDAAAYSLTLHTVQVAVLTIIGVGALVLGRVGTFPLTLRRI